MTISDANVVSDGVSVLIRIDDGLIVHPDQIERADRCGNYTNVWLKGHGLKQIWDEDMRLWQAIAVHGR